MSAPHNWQSNGSGAAGASCGDCGVNIHNGAENGKPCRAPAALARRVDALAADARQLADDLYAARCEAPAGEKAGFRYPLRNIERALAVLGQTWGRRK